MRNRQAYQLFGTESSIQCTLRWIEVATMSGSVAVYEGPILHLFAQGNSYEEISRHLIRLTGETHGFSPRNIRRFCASRGAQRRGSVDDSRLDGIVRSCVARVGHSYGRRTMHGLFRSHGIVVGQSRLAAAMQRVAPIQHLARRLDVHQLMNPLPYRASYFGQKTKTKSVLCLE